MKRLLLAAVGIFSLSACGSGNSTPNNPNTGTNNSSVSGIWDGTLTGSNGAITTYMEITQSNTPNNGDITGKVNFPQIDQNQIAALTGNSISGYLNAIDLTGNLKCQGSFSGFVRYEGACKISSNSGPVDVQLVMKKR